VLSKQAAMGLFALLGMGLAACSSSSPEPQHGADLLTPAQALTVVQQTDSKAVAANGALNKSLQDTFETGPAGLADDAGYLAYKANRVTGLPPFTTADTKVYVPHQGAYPLQFVTSEVATGKTSSGGDFKSTSLSLFVKQTAGDAWKIYYEAYSSTPTDSHKVTPPPAFALDANGYSRIVPSGQGGLVLTPDKVSATIATYINSGNGPVAGGDFTSAYRSQLAAGQAAQSQQCSCHVSSQMSAASYPAYAYQLQDGSALVFYAMSLSIDLTGGQFHSDGSGLGVLGPATSGDYNSLTLTSLEQQVAVLPKSGKIAVLYAYEQQTMAVGGGTTV
jgi:hypothetical protein